MIMTLGLKNQQQVRQIKEYAHVTKKKKKGTAMRTYLNCTPTTDTMELNENTTTSRTFFYSDVP